MFSQLGDLERSALRPGNVHSADGRREVLEPVVSRYRGRVKRLYFRGDAAFANPEIYELLEAEGMGSAIRLPANRVLQDGRNERNAPLIRISGQIRNSGGQQRAVGGGPLRSESAMVFRRFVCRRPDITAPALPRALSRLAAAPYDACEKRAGRVNGLAFTDLWE